ncbi:MAG: glycosyltransferase [Chloroflexi bacterium]|nr:glycosyltransferase [Chloroflexota bacterium]
MSETTGRPRLSVCVIAKNEEENVPRCLGSVRDVADEIVFIDTGSTDRTVELARELGAEVYHVQWQNDFAAAKNAAISHATGDWILFLDADEALTPGYGPRLRALIAQHPTEPPVALRVLIRNWLGDERNPTEFTHRLPRLFTRHPRIAYRGPIHEQLLHLDDVTQLQYPSTDEVVIDHFGYARQVMQRKGKFQRNLPMLERYLAEHPYDPFANFNLGMQYFSMQQYAAAADMLIRTIRLGQRQGIVATDYMPAAFAQAMAALAMANRVDEAIELGREGADLYQHPDLYHNLGGLYLQAGRYIDARTWFERAIELGQSPSQFPSDPTTTTWRPLHGLATVYHRLGQPDRAYAYIQRALTYAPQHPPLLRMAGELLMELGRFGDAADYFTQLRERAPESVEINLRLVDALRRDSQLQAAYDLLDGLLRQHPDIDAYRLQMSDLLYDAEEYEEVIRVLSPYLEREPQDARVYARLGSALSKLDRFEDASNAFAIAEDLSKRVTAAPSPSPEEGRIIPFPGVASG